tara:strand:+ start:230 stop:1597 length:1368 start_codon:yes stop_codon:yes gene_type:complete
MLFKFCLFAILALFIVFTNATASFWPDDQDGVNYLLGIEQYDLIFHQPHFPGYPVYIIVGKLIAFLSSSPERACVFLSVFSGTVCLWLISVILRQTNNRQTALLCTAAMAVNPVFFEFSHKIFTEMPALALLILAIVLLGNPDKASNIRWFSAVAVIGLMLGIRLSWWPFAFFYFIKGILSGKGFYASCGLLLGVLIWLLPQAVVVGPEELFFTGISFTYGHFDKWGGAMASELEVDNRFLLFAIRAGEAFGWVGSGMLFTRLPWIVLTLTGMFIFLRNRNYIDTQIKTFITAVLFYMVWVVIGQNPEKVRHLLPLIPVFILAVSPFIEKYQKTAASTILIFSLTLPLNYADRTQNNPPAVQLQKWADSLPLSDVEFYCGNSERFFDRYPSKQRIKNVTSIDHLQFVIKSSWPKPAQRYVSDDIPGFMTTEEPIAIFSARKGDPVDRTLKLYKKP